MEICFIHQNHRVARSFCDEVVQLIPRRDAGCWIVRVADVNEASLRHGGHFGKIMAKTVGEWNFDDLSAVNAGIINNRLESRIGGDELSAILSCECVCAELKNLTGAITKQGLIVIDVVQLR